MLIAQAGLLRCVCSGYTHVLWHVSAFRFKPLHCPTVVKATCFQKASIVFFLCVSIVNVQAIRGRAT
jgi:hypothetical protein